MHTVVVSSQSADWVLSYWGQAGFCSVGEFEATHQFPALNAWKTVYVIHIQISQRVRISMKMEQSSLLIDLFLKQQIVLLLITNNFIA